LNFKNCIEIQKTRLNPKPNSELKTTKSQNPVNPVKIPKPRLKTIIHKTKHETKQIGQQKQKHNRRRVKEKRI